MQQPPQNAPPGPQDYWELNPDNLTGNPTKFGEPNKISGKQELYENIFAEYIN